MIWAHAGISRRIVIPNHTDILRRMPGQYSNRAGRSLGSEMASLIEEYPGRFVIGSDTVGFFDQYKPTLQRYYLRLRCAQAGDRAKSSARQLPGIASRPPLRTAS